MSSIDINSHMLRGNKVSVLYYTEQETRSHYSVMQHQARHAIDLGTLGSEGGKRRPGVRYLRYQPLLRRFDWPLPGAPSLSVVLSVFVISSIQSCHFEHPCAPEQLA